MYQPQITYPLWIFFHNASSFIKTKSKKKRRRKTAHFHFMLHFKTNSYWYKTSLNPNYFKSKILLLPRKHFLKTILQRIKLIFSWYHYIFSNLVGSGNILSFKQYELHNSNFNFLQKKKNCYHNNSALNLNLYNK